MKKALLVLALISAMMFLTSCTTDVPPEPGSPGAVGKAIEEVWWAEPRDFTLSDDPLIFNDWDDTDFHDIAWQKTRIKADYIYKTAYFLSRKDNPETGEWIPVELNTTHFETVGNWIKNITTHNFLFKSDMLPSEEYGGNILVYSCNKVDGRWDCNGYRWMMAEFEVRHDECKAGTLQCRNESTVEKCTEGKWRWDHNCDEIESCENGLCVDALPPEPTAPGTEPTDGNGSGLSCTDYDGGLDVFVNGKLRRAFTNNNSTYSVVYENCELKNSNYEYIKVENCSSNDKCYVREVYCPIGYDNGRNNLQFIECPNGCRNGACLPLTSNQTLCVDNEWPMKSSIIKGTVKFYIGSGGPFIQNDECNSAGGVSEYYCENNEIKRETLECIDGYTCVSGKCTKD